jgi:hypothetical protein
VQESDDPRSCSYGSTKCLSHMERSNEWLSLGQVVDFNVWMSQSETRMAT